MSASAMISGDISVMGVFSANIESHRTLSVRYFTALSQQIRVCYQTGRCYCFQQDSARAHDACNTVKLHGRELTSFNYGPQLNSPAVKPTDYEI